MVSGTAANKGRFFDKYKAIIIFNRNLIIAGVAGVLSGAVVSQFYSLYYRGEFLNSVVTLATEYGVYIPLFAALFYFSNRHRYVDPETGKKNSKLVREDVKKLLATFSISEVIYSVTKVAAQYQLLQFQIQAYEASIASSIIAWIVFIVAVNLIARLVKLFKGHNNNSA